MKKVLFLFVTLLMISCSSDDDSQTTNSFINPPDWIIGTWLDESEPAFSQIGGFQFTHDNLIDLDANGDVFLNLKEGLQESVDAGAITTNEIITNTVYELKIISNGVETNQYRFTRGTDNTTIVYNMSETYDVVLTKQ